jgi:hypothetical protein
MSNTRESFRGLLHTLETMNLTNFGDFIPRTVVHDALEIKMPAFASKAVFDDLVLRELGAIDYCRNVLLGHGKYLSSCKDGYRILLPSENAKQVELYMQSAEKKLGRAMKLSKNSPATDEKRDTSTVARIEMKMNGVRAMPGSMRAKHAPQPRNPFQ